MEVSTRDKEAERGSPMANEMTRFETPFARWLERWRWPELSFFDDLDVRIEEFVDGDQLVVRAEMPGLDPDKDVDVHIADGALHIAAHREEKKEEQDKDRYRSEFRYGSFTRTVPLRAEVTEDDVKATYKDGILEVRMPLDRAKAAAAAKIPVRRAD
jgi:HSP20 family protein